MKKILVLAAVLIVLAIVAGCTEQDIEQYKVQHPELVLSKTVIPTTIPTSEIPTTIPTQGLVRETGNITPNETPTITITPTITETLNETPTVTPSPTEAINTTPTETQIPTINQTPSPTATTIQPTEIPTMIVVQYVEPVTETTEPTPEIPYEQQIRVVNPAFGSWKIDSTPFVMGGGANIGIQAGLYPSTGYICGDGSLWIKVSSSTSPKGYTVMGYDTAWQIIPTQTNNTTYSLSLTMNPSLTDPYSYYTDHKDEHMTVIGDYDPSNDKLSFKFAGYEIPMSRV